MRFFMDFIDEKKIPLDFVTRHHYTSELPEDVGHYGYIELSKDYCEIIKKRYEDYIDKGQTRLTATRKINRSK